VWKSRLNIDCKCCLHLGYLSMYKKRVIMNTEYWFKMYKNSRLCNYEICSHAKVTYYEKFRASIIYIKSKINVAKIVCISFLIGHENRATWYLWEFLKSRFILYIYKRGQVLLFKLTSIETITVAATFVTSSKITYINLKTSFI